MNRYWTFSGKPLAAWPEADTFALKEAPVPKPADGQALTEFGGTFLICTPIFGST